jgi:hypothetical protein
MYTYIHKGLLHVPLLRQINPVHILTPYLFKIHFNIIILCISLQSCLFPSSFLAKVVYASLLI